MKKVKQPHIIMVKKEIKKIYISRRNADSAFKEETI